MHFYKISNQHFDEWVTMGVVLWPHYRKNKQLLEQTFKKILHSRKQTAFICKNNNELVAFINVSLRVDYVEGAEKSPVGYIEGIYVKPRYRKQGIAKELMRLAEEWAQKRGCEKIGSDTELSNRDSQKFHKNLGFKEVNRIVHLDSIF